MRCSLQFYILKEIESCPWRKDKGSLAGSRVRCQFEGVEREMANRNPGKLSETWRFEVEWILIRVQTCPDSEERESREICGRKIPRRHAGVHVVFW